MFKRSKPNIRKFLLTDAGFLWAAYLRGSFTMPEGLSQEAFPTELSKLYGGFDLLWLIDDASTEFKSGRGCVAIVGLKTDGWTFDPSITFFKWATPCNRLRCLVAFFQFVRYQKTVGICRVVVEDKKDKDMQRMKKYGVLFFRGRIPRGCPTGDLMMFSIAGKKVLA